MCLSVHEFQVCKQLESSGLCFFVFNVMMDFSSS